MDTTPGSDQQGGRGSILLPLRLAHNKSPGPPLISPQFSLVWGSNGRRPVANAVAHQLPEKWNLPIMFLVSATMGMVACFSSLFRGAPLPFRPKRGLDSDLGAISAKGHRVEGIQHSS